MVKSFYDPKIKEEGIEDGIEKGREESTQKARLKDIERVKKLLTKKFGSLEASLSEKIEKAKAESLGAIIEDILDIEAIDEVEKYF